MRSDLRRCGEWPHLTGCLCCPWTMLAGSACYRSWVSVSAEVMLRTASGSPGLAGCAAASLADPRDAERLLLQETVLIPRSPVLSDVALLKSWSSFRCAKAAHAAGPWFGGIRFGRRHVMNRRNRESPDGER
jgi:hypothetical protein